ncbi:hypothetical protein A4D02_33595 [Niastella koreensis]|uniref:DNA 3'-5' helicase II n=2 Tax=Niastella koreensis TaxID=354356 RepID=G8TAG4_NIAKG|nr:UvrD-helicase domain-containing protein [Niastella koreensis]AEV98126.1 hypothetical protein Niako_1763 [Niastella koreensis GR20-10]OQP45334.1 hypothetical protein A4D02_33595 [Niastella koreensis]
MFRPITNDDIAKIEELLLPAGQKFDQQRRDIIQCQHSIDVNACPGSGKTTVMLAKLLLLTRQMPFKNNQGICVLTHTNVAINEIKGKLGLTEANIFNYPNHFGTIQSFVNKFLAIPGYMVKFPGKRPAIIDKDWHDSVVAKRYNSWRGAGKGWVGRMREPIPALQSFKFNSNFDNILTGLGENPVFKTKGSAYKDIYSYKMSILQDGILSFEDAYILAEYYLDQQPQIAKLIQKRFPLVIIDEMQDTDSHQLSLLGKIFNPAKTVIQRIGDENQAIYNKVSSQVVWAIGQQSLPLTGSKRFSTQIANQIDRVCVTPRNMAGNHQVANIQPNIILYTQANIQRVIPHFANLVIESGITTTDRPCKAVGWVKEKEQQPGQTKNCIKSYWPDYSFINTASKTEYNNLNEYFTNPDEEIVTKQGTSYFMDRIYLVLVKLLRMGDIKHPTGGYYSKTALERKIKLSPTINDQLRSGMISWIREIRCGRDPSVDVREFITQQFFPLFGITANREFDSFLNNQNPSAKNNNLQQNTGNIINHSYDGAVAAHTGKEIPIHVNTIHAVKGETHTATLYLETYYFDDDIKRIIAYLKIGRGPAISTKQQRIIETLKMAYVAMSRPTHFLSVAIRSHGITANDIQQLETAGWRVDTVLNV